MIGQRIESQRRFPVGPTLLFTVAGLFILAALLLMNPHMAIFAVMPVLLGFAWLLARERRFAADITATGLEIEEPPLTLSYLEIESVRLVAYARQPRAPIHVYYADGVVRIPAYLNIHSGDLYEYLAEKLPLSGSRELPLVLAKFCADQEGRYGDDRVHTYRALQHRDTYRFRVLMIIGCAIALVGPCWFLGGLLVLFLMHQNGVPWVILSFFAMFLGSLFAFAAWRQSQGKYLPQLRKSGLVIGPGGLALVQGDMTGQLRWDELRDIRFRPTRGFFGSGGSNLIGIHLHVAGATIVILDVYDRPLDMIHEQLRACWEGDSRYR